MSEHKGWIGVDLDGTLARYDEWRGVAHIGDPVPVMLERVKAWLAAGQEVRIFTARVTPNDGNEHIARRYIQRWLLKHLGVELAVTNQKDFAMIQLWDDRAVQVEPNTGIRSDGRK